METVFSIEIFSWTADTELDSLKCYARFQVWGSILGYSGLMIIANNFLCWMMRVSQCIFVLKSTSCNNLACFVAWSNIFRESPATVTVDAVRHPMGDAIIFGSVSITVNVLLDWHHELSMLHIYLTFVYLVGIWSKKQKSMWNFVIRVCKI